VCCPLQVVGSAILFLFLGLYCFFFFSPLVFSLSLSLSLSLAFQKGGVSGRGGGVLVSVTFVVLGSSLGLLGVLDPDCDRGVFFLLVVVLFGGFGSCCEEEGGCCR
jgi:hypothetical protein